MTRLGEQGAITKPWASRLPVAVVYPNTYRVGMGNLGFQYLYGRLNACDSIVAERFFLPDPPNREKNRISEPLSEESGRPLSSFPVVAFSIPFEADYPAVPKMLMAAGIPPLQQDRGPGDPLVIAGGVSVSINPEPIAIFCDLVFVGELPPEDEGSLIEALSGLGSLRPLREREAFLRDVRNVPGVYVPSAYACQFEGDLFTAVQPSQGFPSRIAAVKRHTGVRDVPVSTLFSPDAEFGNTLLVETNRGCSRKCRFCTSGWMHFPVRYRRFEAFRKPVQGAITQGRTIGLIGSDLAGHPELDQITAHILSQGGSFSLSSIRPEGLTAHMIELLAATGQKTATLAPEAASPRMKRVIGKEIPSERFLELITQLVSAGIPNIRYYFMIGLPTETNDDVEAINDFVIRSRHVFVEASRPKGRIGSLGVQVNPFVPKPWTPFQWAPMARTEVLHHRIRLIRQRLGRIPNVTVRVESVREALVQAFLSRGDRRFGKVLLDLIGSNPLAGFKKHGLDPELHLYREREECEPFPWDLLDHGISKAALWKAYQAS